MIRSLSVLTLLAGCPASDEVRGFDHGLDTGSSHAGDHPVAVFDSPDSEHLAHTGAPLFVVQTTPGGVDVRLVSCYEQVTWFSVWQMRRFERSCLDAWTLYAETFEDALYEEIHLYDRWSAANTLMFFLHSNPGLVESYYLNPDRYAWSQRVKCFDLPMFFTCHYYKSTFFEPLSFEESPL